MIHQKHPLMSIYPIEGKFLCIYQICVPYQRPNPPEIFGAQIKEFLDEVKSRLPEKESWKEEKTSEPKEEKPKYRNVLVLETKEVAADNMNQVLTLLERAVAERQKYDEAKRRGQTDDGSVFGVQLPV
jgi:hypothetical protein